MQDRIDRPGVTRVLDERVLDGDPRRLVAPRGTPPTCEALPDRAIDRPSTVASVHSGASGAPSARIGPARGGNMKDLTQMLNTFHSEALRLEALQLYSEASERHLFELYLAGEPVRPVSNEWPEFVRSKKFGRQFQRVRLVTEPLSKYTRFELEWLYPPNYGAGEDIRVRTVDAPYDGPDFWLFDREALLRLHYDDEGALLETERVTDRKEVEAALKDYEQYALEAVPLTEYLMQMRNGQK
ncbi:DUF6879 family protein [Actinoplanes sp. NPDC048791]|uniref:DUF6879 family protein n=1 Tax=Actinoplanes sp. NPDC048791 TaxID=3154623 RepID=UPI0033FB35C6